MRLRTGVDDGAVLRGDLGVWLHRAVQGALEPGIDGWTAGVAAERIGDVHDWLAQYV